MWTKLTALLLLLAVATSASADEPENKCVHGKRYNDGCNWCNCVNGHSLCTLKACFSHDPETGKNVLAKTLSPPEDYWVA